MDDIILAAPTPEVLHQLFSNTQQYQQQAGLIIAPEKVQFTPPFFYLNRIIEHTTIGPQKFSIHRDSLSTLNDFQKLLDINWLCPMLGIPTHQLTNLFATLEGALNLDSPRSFTPQAEQELQFLEEHLHQMFLRPYDPTFPLLLLLFPTSHSPRG